MPLTQHSTAPADRVADILWARWRAHGSRWRAWQPRADRYMVLRTRVKELLRSYDPDCVYVVGCALVDEERSGFDPVKHLTTIGFAWAVERCIVEPGAWRYQRWLLVEGRPAVRDSLTYWLDLWEDGRDAGNPEWTSRAEANLRILERNYYPFPANVVRVERMEAVDLCRR